MSRPGSCPRKFDSLLLSNMWWWCVYISWIKWLISQTWVDCTKDLDYLMAASLPPYRWFCVVVYGVLWFISMHPHGFIGTDHRWWISELRSIIWHFSDHCGQKMFLGVIYPTVWMVQLECDNTLNLKMILKIRRFGLSHGAWKNLFQTSQCLNRNLWSYIVQYLC